MKPTQESRPIAVSTPLGDDVLLLRQASVNEQLGGLFECHLDMLSLEPAIKMEDLLGQPVDLRLDMGEKGPRIFNGFVTRFSQLGIEGGFVRYHATLRPWLWFLTRTADCRIFQEMTVPDIVKQIFRDQGFSDFDEKLSGKYRTWDYCVQYRETDFNFVSRLLEQEGIYYYFTHSEGKHICVLSDSYSSHESSPGYEEVPYFPPAEQARERDHIHDWSIAKDIQPGTYALNDFDFTRPRAGLLAKSSVSREHSCAEYEVYDYPGEYIDSGDGENYAKIRIEAQHAQYERLTGAGNARGLAAGALFKLTDFPRDDQNREYLIVSADHEMESDPFETGSASSETVYSGSIVAIDAQQPYRSSRLTPKPTIQGPQTAIVVGKSGEEIWTDKHGRVKVQFHWDREGKSDESSSCWVRVAQVWAGKNWGSIHIPRIGQEVIVEFLEGDPDRPIITGRVYNGDNKVPYDLPGSQTQSGIKSRSTKGGGGENFNELRFEDKKGEEQLVIHAEKDQLISVENDESHSVGHDRTKDVGNDETTTIGNNRTESVGKNESISIGENRDESVGKNESISIGENRTESVSKNESISIGENRDESVGKNETVDIGKDRQVSVGKNSSLDVGKKLLISAGDEIILKAGDATIVMKKNGTITIKGKNITVQGSGKINVKASGAIAMKGSKVTQN